MILLTGATGGVGSELLPLLLEAGHDVRVLVTDPASLGRTRVDVQVALGDLGNPLSLRHASKGIESVVHLAGSICDQPSGSIEELNGMATVRLLRAAERAGAGRFMFLSSLGASEVSASRFLRSKAVAERTVLASELPSLVFASSVICGVRSGWIRRLSSLRGLPVVPLPAWVQGSSRPLAASDLAALIAGSLGGAAEDQAESRRVEAVGPRSMPSSALVAEALGFTGKSRPVRSVPGPVFAALSRAAQMTTRGGSVPSAEELTLLAEHLGGDLGGPTETVLLGQPFADFDG